MTQQTLPLDFPTRTVYRLEMEDGYGPYTSSKRSVGSDLWWRLHMHSTSPTTHPNAQEDGLYRESGDRFAFDSFDKLVAWFGDLLPELLQAGCRVVALEVPTNDVREGVTGTQIMYRHESVLFKTEVPS